MLQQDLALVEKWRARRDADAFAAIVARHASLVYATSLRITRNRADAEDIAQECFVALAEGKAKIRSSLASWLHSVATHRSLDRLRSDRRRKLREQRSPGKETPSDEVDVSWSDIRGYVDEAMAELPEKLRFPLIAHFLEGQSYQAIAETLDVPRSTVASRVHKGLDLVRRNLSRRGVRATSASLSALLTANAIKAVPSALAAALGKLAIAGAGGASAGVAVTSAGGWVLWQKLTAAAALVAALGFGAWTAADYVLDDGRSQPVASTFQGGGAENAVTLAPPGGDVALSIPVPVAVEVETEEPIALAGAPGEAEVILDVPETGGTVTGRMYDAETNEPVEGALADAFPRGGGTTQGRSVRSDSDGRYRITGLDDGWYNIRQTRVAGYPEQGPGRLRLVKVTADEPIEDVDFAYEPGIRVAGTVTDAGGRPVAEARVGALVGRVGNAEHARSQSDGSFEVFVLPRGDSLPKSAETLFVQAHTGKLESELVGPLTVTEEGIEEVVLPLVRARESSISGTVVDPDDRPLEGVTVNLDRGTSDYLVGIAPSRTDADGRFSISGLAADSYGILLTARGVAVHSLDDEILRIDLSEAEMVTNLRLVFGEDKGGLAIAGRVTDTAGQPIELVEISAQGHKVRQKARSATDGSFRITGLEEGRYFLSAHHVDGNSNAATYSPVSLPGVRAGSEDVKIVLHGKGGIEGRVIRADTGEPVTDFEVFYANHAAKSFSARLLLNRRQVSDPEGRFSLTNLYTGDATITVRAPGLAPSIKALSLVEHETLSGVELRLAPADRLDGMVVAATGAPVAGAMIFVGKIPELGVESQRVALTEEDGSFSIDSLPPGAEVVTAYHPDHGPGFVAAREGTVIVLPVASGIRGRVTWRGEPGAGILLRGVYPDRWYLPSVSATIASDGGYEMTGLAPGKIHVWARHETGVRLEREVDIEPGETTVVDLDFEAGESVVEGKVTIAGAAPARARVSLSVLTTSGRMSFGEEVRPGGSFRLEKLPAGQAVLKVNARDQEGRVRVRPMKMEIGDGTVVRSDVEFTGQGRVTGRVLGLPEGAHGGVLLLEGEVPVPKDLDMVFIKKMKSLILVQTECAADGGFEIDGLEPGTYTVLGVMMPKGAEDPLSARLESALVKLEKDESLTVELDVR